MRHRRLSTGALAIYMLVAACAGDDAETATSATPSTSTPSTTAAPSTTNRASTSLPAPSTTTATTTTTAPPTTTALAAPNTSVPEGTSLRIADQFGLFEGVMGFAELNQDIPYSVEYVTLSPGPVQLQAFRAGEVDLGVVSPLGLIQAQLGDVKLHAVARWRTDFALYALITAPGVQEIDDWDDLRGKRLALQRDTMGEALAMLALEGVGMSLDDVTVVDVPHTQVATALRGGDADVGITGEPFVSAYLTDNPTATYVTGIETPLAQSTIIVAADDAITDPATSSAIAEYLARLDRAFTELTSDRQAFTDLAVAVWNLDRGYVERVLADSEGVRMETVPGDLLDSFHRLAALLAARGDVPADLPVDKLFDERYGSLFPS